MGLKFIEMIPVFARLLFTKVLKKVIFQDHFKLAFLQVKNHMLLRLDTESVLCNLMNGNEVSLSNLYK